MDNDLRLKDAFEGVFKILSGLDIYSLKQSEASRILKALRKIDEVLQVIF
jgi:hypothetical protein